MISHFESIFNIINCFLNVSGKENGEMFVTVSAAVNCLEVIALTGLDSTKRRAATHHRYDNCGNLAMDKVTNTLLLKCDSG
ncbi:hypothetical protein SDC9_117746 [bioreactor metagenome]|uniref:Uncharacterized protein n=1 Tax=bioreactor metagenome TaxID=1076179 RepID=A0A645BZ12_9ZZZZ